LAAGATPKLQCCCSSQAAVSSGIVTALHHIALGTRDVPQIAAFYRDVLELRELQRHEHADGSLRSVWLDLGSALLMIEHSEEPARHVVGIGAGPFLIALAASREEQSRLATKLVDAGCSLESRTEWTLYSRDPDGNRIALSAYQVPPWPAP